MLLSTNKADMYNFHIRTFFVKQCIMSYKVNNVTDCLEICENRSETVIYASPLYINSCTQLKDCTTRFSVPTYIVYYFNN